MTDVSSEGSGSDEERTEVPPKKLKQITLQFSPCASGSGRAQPPTLGSRSNEAHAREVQTASTSGFISNEPCTSECCKGGLTPYQPTESSKFQTLQRQQGKRIRRFSPTWYDRHSWLTVCTTRGKAFCVYCRYCSSKGLLSLAKKGRMHL